MDIDFGEDQPKGWSITDDGVMGGLSEGNAFYTDTSLVFYGDVSLDNNGGFSSLNSEYGNYDLSAYDAVQIRYRSKGVQKAFRFNVHYEWWKPSYRSVIPETDGEWSVLDIALNDFKEYRRGYPTGNVLENNEKSNVKRMGFITGEKKAGPFTFEIDYIRFTKGI